MMDTFSFMFGNAHASAGRSTEGNVPITKRATVITAPVFPALTSASALPSRTSRAATCRELSFLRRKACDGRIVHRDHVRGVHDFDRQVADLVTVQLLPDGAFEADEQHANPQLARGENRTFDFGTRGVVASHGIKSYGNHPGTSGHRLRKAGEGKLGRLGLRVNHFAAVVIAAAGTRPVRKLLFVAIRAFGERIRVKMIVRAAGAGAPF